MKTKSKKYRAAKDRIGNKPYQIAEAIGLLKQTVKGKFDESVEIHFNLGIDPKKSEQIVKGIVTLPHGTGREVKVAVFTESKQAEAKTAGADLVGGKELIEEIIKTGKTDFDAAVATPDFMREITKAAKILGTRGLMPSPKNQTVTADVAGIIKKLKLGQVNFRNDTAGNVHQIIGKTSWNENQLLENFNAFLTVIRKARPKGIKGAFIVSITLCSTMGPGIKIQT